MRTLLSTTAIVLAMTAPAFAGDTSVMPKDSSQVEASSELEGAATAPNTSSAAEISSQAAAPEVQVKQDAEQSELSKSAAEAHKKNVMNGAQPSQSAETDSTEIPVPGMNTAAAGQTAPGAADKPVSIKAAASTKFVQSDVKSQFHASNLIGMRIYATERDIDASVTAETNGRSEWEDIGEIDDIVVSTNGNVTAVILGIGGFLGIGEKDVAVNMNQLSVVRETGDSDDYFLVVKASRDELEAAPAYERMSALNQAN
jgi:hypothetical protein